MSADPRVANIIQSFDTSKATETEALLKELGCETSVGPVEGVPGITLLRVKDPEGKMYEVTWKPEPTPEPPQSEPDPAGTGAQGAPPASAASEQQAQPEASAPPVADPNTLDSPPPVQVSDKKPGKGK